MGVTNSRVLSLEHSDGMWRMLIRCDEGVGTISFVDTGKQTFYRGGGCFSSWSQEQMSATYTALIPKDDSPALELPQLG